MPDAQPLTCDDCGQVVRITAILESEDWEAIAGGAYRLCLFCIDARLAAAGLAAECDLHFIGAALRTTPTPRAIAARAWRPEIRPGEPIGLPQLYRARSQGSDGTRGAMNLSEHD